MSILLVDDHAIVRDGLRRLLEGAGDPILEAASGQDALAMVRAERPDLVVLDLNLPDIGGLDLVARLLREDGGARILVLSMHAEPLYAVRALEAGAMGYVSKSAPPQEILTAVRTVGAGGRYVESAVARDIAARTGAAGGPMDQLSARELDVLRLLAAGRSLGEIAGELGVSYKTVANGCTQLKEKLGASRTADLVRIAVELQRHTTG